MEKTIDLTLTEAREQLAQATNESDYARIDAVIKRLETQEFIESNKARIATKQQRDLVRQAMLTQLEADKKTLGTLNAELAAAELKTIASLNVLFEASQARNYAAFRIDEMTGRVNDNAANLGLSERIPRRPMNIFDDGLSHVFDRFAGLVFSLAGAKRKGKCPVNQTVLPEWVYASNIAFRGADLSPVVAKPAGWQPSTKQA